MKHLILILIVILFYGCKKNVEIFIPHLNGYWEIEKVILNSGIEREYSYNEIIDYFNISDSLKGIRKKLKPSFNGGYNTSKDFETLVLKIENDSLNLYYKTPYDSWKETVLFADENNLKVINQNKNIYIYKRYIPLNLD